MKLFEILDPTICFLTSRVKLDADDLVMRSHLLAPTNPRHHLTETLLERYRPVDKMRRVDTIPLAKRPDDLAVFDQKGNLVYHAVPIGDIVWRDFAWVLRIREAMAHPPDQRPSCEEEARLYWAGTKCWQGESIWEGNVERARIAPALDKGFL